MFRIPDARLELGPSTARIYENAPYMDETTGKVRKDAQGRELKLADMQKEYDDLYDEYWRQSRWFAGPSGKEWVPICLSKLDGGGAYRIPALERAPWTDADRAVDKEEHLQFYTEKWLKLQNTIEKLAVHPFVLGRFRASVNHNDTFFYMDEDIENLNSRKSAGYRAILYQFMVQGP